jgi:hypothetical protein
MRRVRRVQVGGEVCGVEEVEDEELVGEEGGEVIDMGIIDLIANVCLRCIRWKYHQIENQISLASLLSSVFLQTKAICIV